MNIKKTLIAAGALATLAVGAKAANYDSITLTNGGASLTLNNLRNHQLDTLGGQGGFNWYGNSMKQLWFWYRVGSHGREWALSRQEADCTKTDSTAYLHYKEHIPGGMFQAEFKIFLYLTKPNNNKAQLQVNWYMTNLRPSVAGDNGTRTFRLYTYADVDAGGVAGQNMATLDATLKKFSVNRATSTVNVESMYDAPSFFKSQHGYTPTGNISPILDQLADDVDADLSQSAGGGFGPGDWSGAFQHVKSLTSMEQTGGTFIIDVNLPSKVVHPNATWITQGEDFSGDLVSLMNDDGNYYSMLSNGTNGLGEVYFYGQTPGFYNPTALHIMAKFRTDRAGQAFLLYAFNYDTNGWVLVSSGNAQTQDQTAEFHVYAVNNPSKYLDQFGNMKLRLSWNPINDEEFSSDGWLNLVDEITWTVDP